MSWAEIIGYIRQLRAPYLEAILLILLLCTLVPLGIGLKYAGFLTTNAKLALFALWALLLFFTIVRYVNSKLAKDRQYLAALDAHVATEGVHALGPILDAIEANRYFNDFAIHLLQALKRCLPLATPETLNALTPAQKATLWLLVAPTSSLMSAPATAKRLESSYYQSLRHQLAPISAEVFAHLSNASPEKPASSQPYLSSGQLARVCRYVGATGIFWTLLVYSIAGLMGFLLLLVVLSYLKQASPLVALLGTMLIVGLGLSVLGFVTGLVGYSVLFSKSVALVGRNVGAGSQGALLGASLELLGKGAVFNTVRSRGQYVQGVSTYRVVPLVLHELEEAVANRRVILTKRQRKVLYRLVGDREWCGRVCSVPEMVYTVSVIDAGSFDRLRMLALEAIGIAGYREAASILEQVANDAEEDEEVRSAANRVLDGFIRARWRGGL